MRRAERTWTLRAGLVAVTVAAAVACGCVAGAPEPGSAGAPQTGGLARLRAQARDLRTEVRSAEKRLGRLVSGSRASEEEARELGAALRQSGIHVTPRGASVVVVIADRVLFEAGAASLRPEAEKRLAGLAAALKDRFPDRPVSVEGHTDSLVPKKSAEVYPTNWELSAARAVTVARKLAEEGGVSPERVTAVAFADTRPVEKNATPEGRAANRRVEIVLLPPIETARVSDAFAAELGE